MVPSRSETVPPNAALRFPSFAPAPDRDGCGREADAIVQEEIRHADHAPVAREEGAAELPGARSASVWSMSLLNALTAPSLVL